MQAGKTLMAEKFTRRQRPFVTLLRTSSGWIFAFDSTAATTALLTTRLAPRTAPAFLDAVGECRSTAVV